MFSLLKTRGTMHVDYSAQDIGSRHVITSFIAQAQRQHDGQSPDKINLVVDKQTIIH